GSAGERGRGGVGQQAADFEGAPRLGLAPDAPRVRLGSVVENQGRRASGPVQLGDRAEWPGRATFAPRLGLVTEPTRAEVAWVGKEGSLVSYGLAFDQGPAEVEFLFDRVGSVGVLALAAGESLAPGAKLVYRRSLIVSSGGLGDVAKVAFQAQGKLVGTVRGNVQPVPRRGFA